MTIGAQGCLARVDPAQARYRIIVVPAVVLVDFNAATLKTAHGRHTLFLTTQHHWMVGNGLAYTLLTAMDNGHVEWPVLGCVSQRTTVQMLPTSALTHFLDFI